MKFFAYTHASWSCAACPGNCEAEVAPSTCSARMCPAAAGVPAWRKVAECDGEVRIPVEPAPTPPEAGRATYICQACGVAAGCLVTSNSTPAGCLVLSPHERVRPAWTRVTL